MEKCAYIPFRNFDDLRISVENVLRKRKDYSTEQWNRLSFLERKQILDHMQNEHKVAMKRNELRKKRKK